MLSIVLGLGVTQLLSSLALIMRARMRVRVFWPLILWLIFLVLAHVQTWWILFGMRDFQGWTFGRFLMVLAQPVLLFLLSALFTPEPDEGGALDLEQTYWRQFRPFYALWIAVLANSLLRDLALDGRLPTPVNLAFHGAFFVQAAALLLWRNRLFHAISAPVALAGLATYVVALFTQLA